MGPNGTVQVVGGGGKTIQMVSDDFAQFEAKMKTKYPDGSTGNPRLQKQIENEFIAFRRTERPGVSASRVQQLSKETGLQVVRSADKAR
jgi:hypothetical protein